MIITGAAQQQAVNRVVSGGGEISFVGSSVVDGTLGDDLTLPQPAQTHQAGDFGIIFGFSFDDIPTQGVSTGGWTQLRTDASIDGSDRRGAIFYKKYTSNAEANPVCTISAATERSFSLHVFRGVDTTTSPPLDATEQYSAPENSITPSNPAITTATANACLILFHGVTRQEVTAGGVPATPSDMTLGATTLESWRQQFTAYKLNVGSASTFTPSAWTHAGTDLADADSILYTVALKAA